jgi:hypothetical protein
MRTDKDDVENNERNPGSEEDPDIREGTPEKFRDMSEDESGKTPPTAPDGLRDGSLKS